MSSVRLNNRPCRYETEGEGFPLVLVPDESGRIADWTPQMPLWGELCRVIAYEYAALDGTQAPSTADARDARVDDLAVFLRALNLERVYLAGYARGAVTALHFAHRYPDRLEGLLLLGMDPLPSPSEASCNPRRELLEVNFAEMAVPTVVFAGAKAPVHVAGATSLSVQLPHGVKIIISEAGAEPHRETPLPLGHAMMRFLIQCERQRNLVRGASFLL